LDIRQDTYRVFIATRCPAARFTNRTYRVLHGNCKSRADLWRTKYAEVDFNVIDMLIVASANQLCMVTWFRLYLGFYLTTSH
jgi:hypothetical protein